MLGLFSDGSRDAIRTRLSLPALHIRVTHFDSSDPDINSLVTSTVFSASDHFTLSVI